MFLMWPGISILLDIMLPLHLFSAEWVSTPSSLPELTIRTNRFVWISKRWRWFGDLFNTQEIKTPIFSLTSITITTALLQDSALMMSAETNPLKTIQLWKATTSMTELRCLLTISNLKQTTLEQLT